MRVWCQRKRQQLLKAFAVDLPLLVGVWMMFLIWRVDTHGLEIEDGFSCLQKALAALEIYFYYEEEEEEEGMNNPNLILSFIL